MDTEASDGAECILACEDKTFVVNKNILCSRSDYFQRMFRCEMKESLTNQVTLNEIKPIVLQIILNFINSKQFPNDYDEDLLIDILCSSHMFMIDELCDECSRRLDINESNYSKFTALNEIYKNEILFKQILNFQSKHFKQYRVELLRLSSNDLEYLLSNTTISSTLCEIIDFLLDWSNTKEGNISHLSYLFSLVNMSSISEKCLDDYLNKNLIISESSDIRNAFMERAYIDQFHFVFFNNEQFQTFNVKNKEWSRVKKFPEMFNEIHRMFFINEYYYIVQKVGNSVKIIKLSREMEMISCEKREIRHFYDVILINDCLWFISEGMHQHECIVENTIIMSYFYDVKNEKWKLIQSESLFDHIHSVYPGENHLFFHCTRALYDFNCMSYKWGRITPPERFNMVKEVLGICKNHLCLFRYDECIDYLEVNKDDDETARNKFLKKHKEHKVIDRPRGDCIIYEAFSRDLKIFKFISDFTWEKTVMNDFSLGLEKPIGLSFSNNRQTSFMYFYSDRKIFQFHLQTGDWKELLTIPKTYKSPKGFISSMYLSSSNDIYIKEKTSLSKMFERMKNLVFFSYY